MKKKRLFISGGAGVIGTALVNRLLKEDVEIFVGDLKPCPATWQGKLQYRQGDLNEIRKEELLAFNPDIFFHLAATFERSEESESFFSDNFHHNVQLSHHLLTILKEAKELKKIIFASSYLVYDPRLYLFKEPPSKVSVLSEESAISPRNVCGAAKFYHERELEFFRAFLSDKKMMCVRIFRGYGLGSSDLISRWVRSALKGEILKVYRPEGCFDYIFAEDSAEGLLRLSQTEFEGVVNLGSGSSSSVQQVLDIIKSYFPGVKVESIDSQIPFEASQADVALLKRVTGWLPTHTLEHGIGKMIEYEKRAKHLEVKPAAVLMTSISKKIPMIEAVKNAAKKVGSYTLLCGTDSDDQCIGSYFVDQFWKSLPLDEMKPDEIVNYCLKHGIKAIIPSRNGDVEFFSRHFDYFTSADINVMVSSYDTVQRCLDKQEFANFLAEHGFPVIPTRQNVDEILAERFVVKDRYGAGSLKMGINLSKPEAIQWSKQMKHPIFQPFIQGEEYSIDLYRTFSKELKGVVVRKRDRVKEGESQVTTTVRMPELEMLCAKVAEKLGIVGHAVLQVLHAPEGQFHLIECNPRFGGASTASIAVGLDSFYWFFLETLHETMSHYPFQRSKDEVRQVRYSVDKVLTWPSLSSI